MKILLLTDKYFPSPLANAVCGQNVADALSKQGNTVDIIAYKDTKINGEKTYHSMRVHYIKPDIRKTLFYYTYNFPNSKYYKIAYETAKILNRTKSLLMMPFYPAYSFAFPQKLLKLMEQLYKQNNYDMILSIYCPFDNALAAYWFKKKHPSVKWCLYTLDTFINHRYSFLKKKGNDNRWLYKFLELTDMFIYMRSREAEYADNRFDKWRYKMHQSDIPCMIANDTDMSSKNNKSEKTEIWVYAGALYAPHYKADDLIELFLSLPETKKRKLYFYTSGEELENIRHYEKDTNGKIICHGYVSHDKLLDIFKNADILVSMKYTAQISAKIFEYMSYKKPVIHLSGCIDDPNAEYVSHYTLGCVINLYNESKENSIKKICLKINEWNENSGLLDVDLSHYEMNKPEYTASLISRLLYHE